MRITAAIVEDDPSAAQALEHHLALFGEKHGCEFSVARFGEADSFLRDYQPRYDVVFLDIKMPGTDGMSAAEQLRRADQSVMLIFVTSMVQYAVQGYDVNAFDFIVKPVNPTAFEMKLKRAVRALKLARGTELALNAGGVTRLLPSSAIRYIEVMDHDLTYHTEQGVFSVRGKLSSVEQKLPAASFFRCSVSYLINLRYVTQFTGDQVCVAGEWLRVSRGRKKELAAAVAAYLGQGV